MGVGPDPATTVPQPVPVRRAGRTGLDLPTISLGLWQNMGRATALGDQLAILQRAVELGVVHLDLANNYGPPPGEAERVVGRLLRTELAGRRDELLLCTKAGYRGWDGPYGEGSSRKNLLASLDRSLRNLGIDHVDVFYSHRFDPTTPVEETIGALGTALASGRARYVGLSSWSARRTVEALSVARAQGVPLTLHQSAYSMLNRWVERPDPGADGRSLLDVLETAGMGMVAFSPLAQGVLTPRYLDGIPTDSRIGRGGPLRQDQLGAETLARVRALDGVARRHGRTLPQLALGWVLRDPRVTSVVIGASRVSQLEENLRTLAAPALSEDELALLEPLAVDTDGVNVWGPRSSDL